MGNAKIKPTLISVLVNLQFLCFSYPINGVKRHQTLQRLRRLCDNYDFSLKQVGKLFNSYTTENDKQASKLPLPPLYTLSTLLSLLLPSTLFLLFSSSPPTPFTHCDSSEVC